MPLRRALLHAGASLVRHPARHRLLGPRGGWPVASCGRDAATTAAAAAAAASAAHSLSGTAASCQCHGREVLGRQARGLAANHLGRGAPPEPKLGRRRVSLLRQRALERRHLAGIARGSQLALRSFVSVLWAEDSELREGKAQRILCPRAVQRVGPPVVAQRRRCGVPVRVGLGDRPAETVWHARAGGVMEARAIKPLRVA